MPKLLANWCDAGSVGFLRLRTACSVVRKTRATPLRRLFLAAFRNLRGFRGEAKVSSWLHRIAVNQCISRQRRAKVRSESALGDEQDHDAGSFATPVSESPVRVVEGRQETLAVRRAINSLPIELRQVVVMKEFEELTFREIADALDLPLSTVKSRLYTALKQLQMRLQKFESRN
jgi:RNA polymerase sigma-70 factor (ECF subfamily)